MNIARSDLSAPPAPFEVLSPARQTLPMVLASPHSGQWYPADFLASSRLDSLNLRRSEDSFVDELFAAAPSLGAPLVHALFARAYVDANREPFELDPEMFEDELPVYVNARSPRVAAGLGTIARTVANGQQIYRGRLQFTEAVSRIETFYRPYHAALRRLVDQTVDRFGFCVLLDCHSMPSNSMAPARRIGRGNGAVDIVLGDLHGTSCASVVVNEAETAFTQLGYRVVRNVPYAGGYTTRHYGNPGSGVHTLQLELNRAIYMDEARIQPNRSLKTHHRAMTRFMERLGETLLRSRRDLLARN